MKHFILILISLLMLAFSFTSGFSESADTPKQGIAPLIASLSDGAAPGSGITVTWKGDDGRSFSFIIYPEAAASDAAQPAVPQEPDKALTAEELLNLIDWVENQLRTQAAEGDAAEAAFDPAVFQTAQPEATLDPAVFYTAQPAQTLDPAVCWTARPAAIPTPRPVICCTSRPTAAPASVVPAATRGPAKAETPRPMASPTVSTGDYTTFDSTMQEQKLLNLLNEDRARYGLPPLTLDPELSRLAQLKSDDMNSSRYFGHESPTYGNAAQMLDTFHYDYSGVGENIAHHANVEKAEAAFMSSDGHRRNILGSQWDKVGIGIAYDPNGNVYVTQLFTR